MRIWEKDNSLLVFYNNIKKKYIYINNETSYIKFFSIYFVSGHGSMGISNSIGSNTFDILLCLGLPWLIKSSFSPTQPGKHYISINSGGLEYSAISLLSTLMLLYIAFASNKFQLDRKVGRACLCMYAVFLILASLIELNVFFRVNLPTCQRTVKWSEIKSRLA